MTCRRIGTAIVCGPPGIYRRAIKFCPVCDRRHRFVISWDGAWYGTTLYGSCGDSWQDGELGYRPFRRGWRKEAQEHFRAMWDHAASREAYDRYVEADGAIYSPHVRSQRQERKAFRRLAIAAELIRRERAA